MFRRDRHRNPKRFSRFAATLRGLRRDTRAAAIIEFALVAGPLIALLLAIVETSLVYFGQEALETATEAAARTIMSGQAQKAGYTQAQFLQSTCTALPAFMPCSGLLVDVESVSSFGAASTTTPTITFNSSGQVSNTFQYNPGAAGSIVIVRLMYIWPMPAGPLGFNIDNLSNGQRLLIATSVAKTEPYS